MKNDPGKYVQTWLSTKEWKAARLAARQQNVSLSRLVADAILAVVK